MRKRIIVTAGIISAALAACGSHPATEPAGFSATPTVIESVDSVSETVSKTPDEAASPDAYKNKANYKVLEDFTTALMAGDYPAMMELIYFPETRS